MPVDKDVYPEPPSRTPVRENKSGLPDFSLYVKNFYTYAVDWPVTSFHDFVEAQRAKRKIYYYHRVFQRVPDLSQCLEDDLFCQYEAEMQWRRDLKVDAEILKIVRGRYEACLRREGYSSSQNCAELREQLTQVSRGYKNRYEYLGANGNARKCLMKQKERMIEEKKAAKEDQA
ncbi:NADH dehydrogenase [ubiquinone] 1 beta subcomplex subunit 10 [Rana temporaria]|uniref:NADH dehydrogenase [ubiquinone] 1 beta subcomplex subunit 10 n=1 Tax=Rana temporaria TaxID=8407 RepID=UPI001AACC5A3|nr:NADH dehydrogenase [ubiquinone] 1 beta subcomplex subunit 10 [Rana temporaria]